MTAPILPPTLISDLDPAADTDTGLLALNNAHAEELSPLDCDRMAHLIGQAFMAARVGRADGLLLAFDQDADYDSPNFLWFRERFTRFVYVDRIVIAPLRRGHGLARSLYQALFARATEAGHEQVVCEVNADPPNPSSDAFHATLGFVEIGSAVLAGKGKRVRYFRKALA